MTAVMCLAAVCLQASGVAAPPPGRDPEYGGKPLGEWVREIRDPDPGVRATAMQAVINFGESGAKAARALVSELQDRDPSLRANAAYALMFVGMPREEVKAGMAALGRALGDSQQIVRYRAATTLGAYGRDARDAIPALVGALKDPYGSWEVRKAAAYALGAAGADPQAGPNSRAVAALKDGLRDPCAQVRLEVVTALVGLGKPAAAEQAALRQALRGPAQDRDKVVALWSRVALMQLDRVTPEGVKDLGALLKSPEVRVRTQAARALWWLGPKADVCVPELTRALGDPEGDVLYWSMMALKRLGSAADDAVPELQRLAKSENARVKRLAQECLEAITKRPMGSQAAPGK